MAIVSFYYKGLCKICIKSWFEIKETCPHTNEILKNQELFP